jgi:hypothetical protein
MSDQLWTYGIYYDPTSFHPIFTLLSNPNHHSSISLQTSHPLSKTTWNVWHEDNLTICMLVLQYHYFDEMFSSWGPLECNDAPHHQWRERFIGLEIATFVARPFTLGLCFTTPNLLGRKGVAIKTRPSQVYHWSFQLSPSRSNRDRWIQIKDQNRVRGEFWQDWPKVSVFPSPTSSKL